MLSEGQGKISGEFKNENIVCYSMNSKFAFPEINSGRQKVLSVILDEVH